jgi:hypothetical protein
VTLGRALGIAWPAQGQWHNVRAWAELLVTVRASGAATAYASPGFGAQVLSMAQRLEGLWSETLRYHKNVAYPYEVQRVRAAAEWLLAHTRVL